MTDEENKRTVILGASTNPARYSYKAARKLADYHHEIIPVGLKKGQVSGVDILDIRQRPVIDHVHTITLYMNPVHQQPYYDYILSLKPVRIIFNPGTENRELADLAEKENIVTDYNCTLVMLHAGIY